MPLTLTPWQVPTMQPRLLPGEVHLWRFPLASQGSLEYLLDQHELQRAKRLRSRGKAQTFVIARARLRQILAGYLSMEPQALVFNYGSAGKPGLAGLAEAPAFNLSHSGGWGLCAVAGQGEVGVDIETIDPALDYAKLAERFFSDVEKWWLSECQESRRRRCFYRIWTRKEAWLKGKGGGFSEASQDLGHGHLAGCYTYSGGWWLRSFPVDRGSLAALSLSREFSLVQRWNGWMDCSKFS